MNDSFRLSEVNGGECVLNEYYSVGMFVDLLIPTLVGAFTGRVLNRSLVLEEVTGALY